MKRLSHSISPGGRQGRGSAPSAQWSTASAVVIAGAAAGLTVVATRAEGRWFGRESHSESEAESESGPSDMELILRSLRPWSGYEALGIGFMVAALVLLASAQYLARSRRALVGLMSGALFCGLLGYALYDWYYLYVNVGLLRNIDALRADCESMLRDGDALWLKPGYTAPFLNPTQLPESLRRVEIMSARMYPDHIVMYYSYDLERGGILYYPHRTQRYRGYRWESLRHTWFPGFYKHGGYSELTE